MTAVPVTLVVVDDDADGADMMANLLRLSGYDVHLAYDALSGESLVERVRPLGALIDLRMPGGIDGCELIQRLRSRYGDDLVLIAITGADSGDPRVAAAFACVDHHLCKPIDAAVLAKVLPPLT